MGKGMGTGLEMRVGGVLTCLDWWDLRRTHPADGWDREGVLVQKKRTRRETQGCRLGWPQEGVERAEESWEDECLGCKTFSV